MKKGKNIIVFSDGTGNTAIKDRGTNVFKMFESVDLESKDVEQVIIYDDGVGTEDLKPLRLLAGAFGFGLSRNIRQLYEEITHVYKPNDRIFLFGFSRGAFTVRFLAGLIGAIGIIDINKKVVKNNIEQLKLGSNAEIRARIYQGFREYRVTKRAVLEKVYGPVIALFKWIRGLFFTKFYYTDSIVKFREEFCHPGPNPIHFIGVWDTVCAVGLPFRKTANWINKYIYHYTFSDQKLAKSIKYAFHALSIDDQRKSFHPYLMDESEKGADQTIEQVWFAGVHANIGGGYPKQGMSLVPLYWMLNKAQLIDEKGDVQGIRFNLDKLVSYREGQNVHDKMYDSRAGFSFFYRYSPRDIHQLCLDNHVKPLIHSSVCERIYYGTEGYAPGNLPKNFSVQAWDDRISHWPNISEDMSSKLPEKHTSLLHKGRVKVWMRLRIALYWAFVVTAIYAVVNSKGLVNAVITSDYSSMLFIIPLTTIVALLLFYLLAKLSKNCMKNIFSEFWHNIYPARG